MDNNQPVELRSTEDGSLTLYNRLVDECYHSVHGARQESEYIFIQSALRHCTKQELNIFEVGFGTGLNALLTLRECGVSGRTVHYSSIELYPLKSDIYMNLNYAAADEQVDFIKLHQCEWGATVSIEPFFSLKKIESSLLEYVHKDKYDVVYFDAFSPEKQPELWSEQVFKALYDAMNPDGILTTYCAKGEVRRTMQRVGFSVERIPGPPGKRHILRAIKHGT